MKTSTAAVLVPVLLTVAAARTVAAPQEIGANDFRISDMGPDGDTAFGADTPSVAHNPSRNEYLVVWRGNDDAGSLAPDEREIYGQRIDAVTGQPIGGDFRISDMGPDGDPFFHATMPSVTYRAAADEYLVVWAGVDSTPNVHEIYGQRLSGTGDEIGANDFRISDAGPVHGKFWPVVAYGASHDEYLVVWYGPDPEGGVAPGYEAFAQRLNGVGEQVGADDFRISDMTGHALVPSIAFNSTDEEYLVVWFGVADASAGTEVYGQRIAAGTGLEVGADDFRISDMGPDGGSLSSAIHPSVTYGETSNEYLVVWAGDDAGGVTADNELEVFAQRLNRLGGEIGPNDMRISDMGPDGDDALDANFPRATYNASTDEYLVVWFGSNEVEAEYEIHGQRLDGSTGAELGVNDFRISDTDAPVLSGLINRPAVAAAANEGEFLTVWHASDDAGALVGGELEILGQRLLSGPLSLTAEVNHLSLSTGGTQSLALDAGVEHAGGTYLVLGSLSGTKPGLALGAVVLPLNPDGYFTLTLTQPAAALENSAGFLDEAGRASAAFRLPTGLPASLAGVVAHHAFGLLGDPFVSNPVPCTLMP